MINNRIYGLLSKLINYDQSGFIKGQNFGDNLHLMLNIIDYANCKKVPGAVLFIDLCKSFDYLKLSFAFEMLKLYVFDSKIINWIKILCKKIKCRVMNNNYLSYFFDIKKGVRPGDPLSFTIGVLRFEYLAAMLRQSKNCKGFKIKQYCFKVSLFAVCG